MTTQRENELQNQLSQTHSDIIRKAIKNAKRIQQLEAINGKLIEALGDMLEIVPEDRYKGMIRKAERTLVRAKVK